MNDSSQFLSEVKTIWTELGEQPTPITSPPHTKAWHFPDHHLVIRLIPLGDHLNGWDIDTLPSFLELAPRNSQSVHIWEDVWRSNPTATRGRILALFGESSKIHGRETSVSRIAQPQLQEFLTKHHTNVPLQAKYKYGLFHQDELVAVATFAPIRTLKKENNLSSSELIRFCNSSACTVVGGLSKLIKAFIEEKDVQHLMTYADRDWSNGQGYERLGFERVGEKKPQKFWIDPDTNTRHYLNRLPMEIPSTWLPAYNLGSWKYVRVYP